MPTLEDLQSARSATFALVHKVREARGPNPPSAPNSDTWVGYQGGPILPSYSAEDLAKYERELADLDEQVAKAKKASIVTALYGFAMECTYIPQDITKLKKGDPRPGRGGTSYAVGDLAGLQLKYEIRLTYKGRLIFEKLSFSMGTGHIPESRHFNFNGLKNIAWVAYLEVVMKTGCTGVPSVISGGWIGKGKPILPALDTVIYCVLMDSNVLDYSKYEDWASDMGVDPDSRKGEATYRQCLEQSLAFVNSIGREKLAELQKAFEDY